MERRPPWLPPKAILDAEYASYGLPTLDQGDRDVCSLFAITAVAEFEFARSSPNAHARSRSVYLIWAAKAATGKDIALDGKPVGPEVDLFASRVSPSGALELGVHELGAGPHQLRVTSVGKIWRRRHRRIVWKPPAASMGAMIASSHLTPAGRGVFLGEKDPLPMEIVGTVTNLLREKDSHLWTIHPDSTVYEAIELMAGKNIGAVPVVGAGKLLGILSERDYTRKVILRGKSSKETPVHEIMTKHLHVVSPDDPVGECMRLMTTERVRHLPVLDEGKLVGILSIGDCVKWIISAQTATIDQLTKYVFGE